MLVVYQEREPLSRLKRYGSQFGGESAVGKGGRVSLLRSKRIIWRSRQTRSNGVEQGAPSHSSLVMPYFLARFSAVTQPVSSVRVLSSIGWLELTTHWYWRPAGVLIDQGRCKRVLQFHVCAVSVSKSGKLEGILSLIQETFEVPDLT
jgi:hypothetical protein